jgi:hypothetical protein
MEAPDKPLESPPLRVCLAKGGVSVIVFNCKALNSKMQSGCRGNAWYKCSAHLV